jgi:hypothetical protein
VARWYRCCGGNLQIQQKVSLNESLVLVSFIEKKSLVRWYDGDGSGPQYGSVGKAQFNEVLSRALVSLI